MIIKFLPSQNDEDRLESNFFSVSRTGNIDAAACFIEASSMTESSNIVAAHLTERDFRLATLSIPEMRGFQDYEDWLDYRMATSWGLEMAGYTVEMVPVDLSKFIAWRRSASEAPTISALDRFARISKLRVVETKPGKEESQG